MSMYRSRVQLQQLIGGWAMTRKTEIVPKELYKFLDHTTASLFLGLPYMRGFVEKTYASGIERIGILVQMAEADVFRQAPTSAGNRAKLKDELLAAGLTFGMKAPGWKNPCTQSANTNRSTGRSARTKNRNDGGHHR